MNIYRLHLNDLYGNRLGNTRFEMIASKMNSQTQQTYTRCNKYFGTRKVASLDLDEAIRVTEMRLKTLVIPKQVNAWTELNNDLKWLKMNYYEPYEYEIQEVRKTHHFVAASQGSIVKRLKRIEQKIQKQQEFNNKWKKMRWN